MVGLPYDLMGEVPSPAACMLIGMFLACILYGIFIVLFCGTIYVFYKRDAPRPNPVLLIASLLLFIFTTVGIMLKCLRTFDGLIMYSAIIDPDLYFFEFTSWDYMCQETLGVVVTIIADAVMIYRCWVVWSYQWRIVAFNVLLWLCNIATGIVMLVFMSRTSAANEPAVLNLNNWTLIFLSVTFVQNVITTSMSSFRLWRVNAAVAAHKQSSLLPLMWILVESGSLYVAMIFIFLVGTILDSTIVVIIADIIEPVIGIAFSLIIVRVGLGLTRGSSPASSVRPSMHVQRSGAFHQRAVNIPVHAATEIETESGNHGDFDIEMMDGSRRTKEWGSQKELGGVAD